MGVLLMNLIVTLSPSVNLSGGAGIVPLNVQVLTTFPGAILSSASCAIRVYSFLGGGGVELMLVLVVVAAAASVGPLTSLLLSILIILLEKGIRVPNTAVVIIMLHKIMVRAGLFVWKGLFDIPTLVSNSQRSINFMDIVLALRYYPKNMLTCCHP